MKPKGVEFVAIMSNDASVKQNDSPEKLRERAVQKNYPFPYLFDERKRLQKIWCCLYARFLCL